MRASSTEFCREGDPEIPDFPRPCHPIANWQKKSKKAVDTLAAHPYFGR
jgi:hypothetical protein